MIVNKTPFSLLVATTLLMTTTSASANYQCTGFCKILEFSSSTTQPSSYSSEQSRIKRKFKNRTEKMYHTDQVGKFFRHNYQYIKQDAARGDGPMLDSFASSVLLYAPSNGFKQQLKTEFYSYFHESKPTLRSFRKMITLRDTVEKNAQPDPRRLYFRRYAEIRAAAGDKRMAHFKAWQFHQLAKLLAGRRSSTFRKHIYQHVDEYFSQNTPSESGYNRLMQLKNDIQAGVIR